MSKNKKGALGKEKLYYVTPAWHVFINLALDNFVFHWYYWSNVPLFSAFL